MPLPVSGHLATAPQRRPLTINTQYRKLFLFSGRVITSRCLLPLFPFNPSPNFFRPPAPAGAPFSNRSKTRLYLPFKTSRSNFTPASPSPFSGQTAPANPRFCVFSRRSCFPPLAPPPSPAMTPSPRPAPFAVPSATTPVPTRAFMRALPRARISYSSAASMTSPQPPHAIAFHNWLPSLNSPNLSIARCALFLPAPFNV